MSMPRPPSIDGGWSPERELTEPLPRRLAPSDYPDLNKPNAAIFIGLGAAFCVLGLVGFFVGLSKSGLYVALGILVLLLGGASLGFYQFSLKKHVDRATLLVENGTPVMARIVQVQNATGDSQYGRVVTYFVTLPGDTEETRREVKADERALPKRLPGNATALLDFNSREIELYCALPFKAVAKFATAGNAAEPENTPDLPFENVAPTPEHLRAPERTGPRVATNPGMANVLNTPANSGGMATIGNTDPEPTGEKPAEKKPSSGAAKLPWEQ